jgi:hypothetical protein
MTTAMAVVELLATSNDWAIDMTYFSGVTSRRGPAFVEKIPRTKPRTFLIFATG